MCHETNDREDDEPSKHTGATVDKSDYNCISVKGKTKYIKGSPGCPYLEQQSP